MAAPKRQFNLRHAFVLILLMSVVLSWIAEWRLRRKLEQVTQAMIADKLAVLEGQERMTARLRTLSEANKVLRERLGDQNRRLPLLGHLPLALTDPQKAYVEELRSAEPTTWKYRVYLPPDRVFKLCVHPQQAGLESKLAPTLTGHFTVEVLVWSQFIRIKTPEEAWVIPLERDLLPAAKRIKQTAAKGQRFSRKEMSGAERVDVSKLVDPQDTSGKPLLEVYFKPV